MDQKDTTLRRSLTCVQKARNMKDPTSPIKSKTKTKRHWSPNGVCKFFSGDFNIVKNICAHINCD